MDPFAPGMEQYGSTCGGQSFSPPSSSQRYQGCKPNDFHSAVDRSNDEVSTMTRFDDAPDFLLSFYGLANVQCTLPVAHLKARKNCSFPRNWGVVMFCNRPLFASRPEKVRSAAAK